MPVYNEATLAASEEMTAISGTIDIAVPIDVLWGCFSRADWWPRWNTCMYMALNQHLERNSQLRWAFDPIRWWYPYKLPGQAKIVELEERSHVTWEVTVLPGFFARHTYFMEDLGGGHTRFGSWEKAMGPTLRLLRKFWLSHFVFVKERSLQGASYLEHIYRRYKRLDEDTLQPRSYLPFAGFVHKNLVRPFKLMQMTYQEVGPGVYAALGGGGNSLIVHDAGEILLVDSKFPPFAGRLKKWIDRKFNMTPVTTLVNTHFHYDHTWGNHLYPQARIIAHHQAPELMLQRDPMWWRNHPEGLPKSADLVRDSLDVTVGGQDVTIHYTRRGHTATDIWLHLQRGGNDIIATGDVPILDVHPFFDLGEGGANIPNMIRLLNEWARDYPQATFVPGHGPEATAADLLQHAHFLEFIWESVAHARERGLSEQDTIANVDLNRYRLANLPIFHYGYKFLSASSTVGAIYRLQAETQTPI